VGCCIPGVGLKSAGKFPLWHIPQCILDHKDGTMVPSTCTAVGWRSAIRILQACLPTRVYSAALDPTVDTASRLYSRTYSVQLYSVL
jgi:hypothetical protein